MRNKPKKSDAETPESDGKDKAVQPQLAKTNKSRSCWSYAGQGLGLIAVGIFLIFACLAIIAMVAGVGALISAIVVILALIVILVVVLVCALVIGPCLIVAAVLSTPFASLAWAGFALYQVHWGLITLPIIALILVGGVIAAIIDMSQKDKK